MHLTVSGGQVPQGRVEVSGAKNSATRLMAAALLTDDRVVLSNFPTTLVDVNHKANFIRAVGVEVELSEERNVCRIDAAKLVGSDYVEGDYPIRTTYLLAAGQLHRSGKAFIPYPGGCRLGTRGYDLHVMVWQALGCEVSEDPDGIRISGELKGGKIDFPITTVGGTENALLCTVLAQGESEIQNAYITPEVEDLIKMLRLMGAQIEVFGSSNIRVQGVRRLGGVSFKVIPDRIEAITWMVYAAVSGGDVEIANVPMEQMSIPLEYLRAAGIDFLASSDTVRISPSCMPNGIQPFEVACGTHPGVVSDMQPFYTLLALYSKGNSLVVDYRYPERVAYLEQLSKIYPNQMSWENGKIMIRGGAEPVGAEVRSTDLRGSMALVLGGLLAEGQTQVKDAHMALRGYDSLQSKMLGLGVSI